MRACAAPQLTLLHLLLPRLLVLVDLVLLRQHLLSVNANHRPALGIVLLCAPTRNWLKRSPRLRCLHVVHCAKPSSTPIAHPSRRSILWFLPQVRALRRLPWLRLRQLLHPVLLHPLLQRLTRRPRMLPPLCLLQVFRLRRLLLRTHPQLM